MQIHFETKVFDFSLFNILFDNDANFFDIKEQQNNKGSNKEVLLIISEWFSININNIIGTLLNVETFLDPFNHFFQTDELFTPIAEK